MSSVEPLTVDTPQNVKQCDNVFLQWQGGTAPYSVEVLDSRVPLGVVGTTSKTTFVWNADVNITNGPFTIVIQDSGRPRLTTPSKSFDVTADPENCLPGGSNQFSSIPSSLSMTASSTPSPGTTATMNQVQGSSSKPSAGLIAGVTIAGVAGLVVIVLLGFFCLRRRKSAPTRQDLLEEEKLGAQIPYTTPYTVSSPHDGYRDDPAAGSSSGASAVGPYNPYPSTRHEKGQPVRVSAASPSRHSLTMSAHPAESSVPSTLDRAGTPVQRQYGREADAGVRVIVDDEEEEMDTLPPAYGDIPRGPPVVIRSDQL